MSTIKDVAKAAGVSVATVSNALTSNRCVNIKTKAKIVKIANELSYSPNMIASSMVTKKTNIFGVFLYDFSPSNFLAYSEFLSGVVAKCQHNSQRVLIYADIKENELRNSFVYGREPIDGGIIFCPQADEFRTSLLKNANIPFVFIGKTSAPNFCYVDAENAKTTYEITKKMIKYGHNKLVLFNAKQSWLMSSDIYEGFVKALNEFGINILDCRIHNYSGDEQEDLLTLESYIEQGYDAFISIHSFIVEGIYKKAKKYNYIIGKNMSVAFLGYDNKFDFVIPSLTYCKLQYDIVGNAAVELLMNNIKHKVDKKNIYIQSNIIDGDSIVKLKSDNG